MSNSKNSIVIGVRLNPALSDKFNALKQNLTHKEGERVHTRINEMYRLLNVSRTGGAKYDVHGVNNRKVVQFAIELAYEMTNSVKHMEGKNEHVK